MKDKEKFRKKKREKVAISERRINIKIIPKKSQLKCQSNTRHRTHSVVISTRDSGNTEGHQSYNFDRLEAMNSESQPAINIYRQQPFNIDRQAPLDLDC